MSMKELAKKTAAAMAAIDTAVAKPDLADAQPRRTVSNPGAMLLMQPKLQEADDRATKAEEAAERYKRQAGHAVKIRLSKLVSVPGRRRRLSEEEYTLLRENLRLNPMVNPVVVKSLADGLYEIISGENRAAVYRELDRDEIDCLIRDVEGDETAAAFYANLLQPSLPDFEKYFGFKTLMAEKDQSLSQVASAAGISKSYLSRIMTFGALPEKGLALLATRPAALGAIVADGLASLAANGYADGVVDAIEKLVAGELTQGEALKYAAAKGSPKPEKPAPEKFKIKHGRSVFCDVRAAGAELRVSFADETSRKAVQAEILKVLEKYGR